MYYKISFRKFKKIPIFSLLMLMAISFIFQPGCDRPGGEDEEGNSFTYGLQITSVIDDEERTPYIIFDMSSENVGTDESAEITVGNIMPTNDGSSTTLPDGGSTIFAYDETDSIHLTAYRVDYHIDGFGSISSYIGRINIVVPVGGSQTFDILLLTGVDKESISNILGYDYQKGYLTIRLSGYDGDGNEESRAIDVDAFVYTYKRSTPTATESSTPTLTPTATTTSTP